MATSIIKTDELRLLNDQVVMSDGALTENVDMSNVNMSNMTFPAGHIIQTQYRHGSDSSYNRTINNFTAIGIIDLEFNRKMSDSYFLINVSSLIYRPATASAAYIGYQMSVNGSVITTKSSFIKDDNSWHVLNQIFKDTTTGSVNDTIKIENIYRNNASNDNYFQLPTLLVHEVAP